MLLKKKSHHNDNFSFIFEGAKSIIQEFPEITILTTEVHPVAPTHFGQKYFGTD